MRNKEETILIPDEFTPDYSLPKEEREEEMRKWREKSRKAWKELTE